MSETLAVALIAVGGTVVGAVLALLTPYWTDRVRHRRDADSTLAAYREPLISSAFDLQSRIYNILRKDFLTTYSGNQSRRAIVALESTLFNFAQYFGWREIVRREIEFLNLPQRRTAREVNDLLGQITRIFASDSLEDRRFLLWKSEQRAIGELMIDDRRSRPTAMGYAQFVRERHGALKPWLDEIEHDLLDLGDDQSLRLSAVQHALAKLMRTLDPDRIRYRDDVLKPV